MFKYAVNFTFNIKALLLSSAVSTSNPERSTLDVIQSNSLLLSSKISMAESERNYLLSQFKLLQAVGNLSNDYLKLQ